MSKNNTDHDTCGLFAARLGFGPAILHRTFEGLSKRRIRRLYEEEKLPTTRNGNRIRRKPVHLFAGKRDEANQAKRMACSFLACVYEKLKDSRYRTNIEYSGTPDLYRVYLAYRISLQILRFYKPCGDFLFEPDEAFLLVESLENKTIFLERCRCGYPILLDNAPVFTHETRMRKPIFHCPWCDEHGPLYGAFLEVKLQRHSEWVGHTDSRRTP